MCDESKYLTGIPQELSEYGFCKVLNVRNEVIHIKHIFTEIFVRKTFDIHIILDLLGWDLMDYMHFMTVRLRKIHHFPRTYVNSLDRIVKDSRDRFFPTIELLEGASNVIVLDFDGVVTEQSFKPLYDLCLERCRTEICSGNPTITESWFEKRGYSLPNRINSMKGKVGKINRLIEISKKYDNTFYIDNETKYLDIAWALGIKTFLYSNKKISFYTLNTK